MSHVAKAYGVIRVKRNKYGRPNVSTGLRPVDSITLSKVVQNRTAVTADETLVEIELDFPDGYFDANTPKVTVVFPELSPSQVTGIGGFVAGATGVAMNTIDDQTEGDPIWLATELATPMEV